MNQLSSRMLFCLEEYATVQNYVQYFRFQTKDAVWCFEINNGLANSLPKSPQGGFVFYNPEKKAFIEQFQLLKNSLKELSVKKITITTPIEIYPGTVPYDWMVTEGFSLLSTEISHFVPLSTGTPPKFHLMEKRILSKAPDFDISLEKNPNLIEIHEFIAQCRKKQNLSINIDLASLIKLFEAFSERYQVITARHNTKLVGCLIVVLATDRIVYYFLPATHVEWKSKSPMVHIMKYVYDHFTALNFDYLDLGISSNLGIPQTNLIKFKERMGGIQTMRHTWEMELC